MRRTILTLVFAFCLDLTGCAGRIVLALAPDSVPLRMTDGLVSVPVTINGAGPYTFILDTGSNRTGVSSQLAARLGLPAVATTTVVSSTGAATANVIRLGEVGLGRAVRHDLLTAVLPAHSPALGTRADGVLGQDFLADETYTIDYGRRRLVWDAAAEPPGTRLALKRDEGRWLVALPQDARGNEVVWFVPDSGAQALVVFDRGTRLPLRLTSLPDVAVSAAAGRATTKAALVQLLRVGKVQLADQPAIVIDRRSPDGPAGDGLLPLCVFSTVTFNGKEGYLVVGR